MKRNLRIVVFIHEVNQYNCLIPSVNVSRILNTSFVYSFFMLHINLTEYKQILCEKNVIFANFVWKIEKCRRTLEYIFQTNIIILMKLSFPEWNDKSFAVYRFKISRNLSILLSYQNLNIVSDFKSGFRNFWSVGLQIRQPGVLKCRSSNP